MAIRLIDIVEKKYKATEVHPTLTRKALQLPPKGWKTIQEILTTFDLKVENALQRPMKSA